MTIAEIDHSATRGSLQSEAYKRLREIIIRQELSPGSKVSELTLSRLTGYGRAPVRVALRGLVAEGLVQIVPQSGVVVARIEPKTELKVLEVRAELERLLTKCALNRATDRHRMRMLVIVHQLRNEVRKENLAIRHPAARRPRGADGSGGQRVSDQRHGPDSRPLTPILVRPPRNHQRR